MSTTSLTASGADIRPLHEHEIGAVNGGFIFALIIGAELFLGGAAIGYIIADSRLPQQFRDL